MMNLHCTFTQFGDTVEDEAKFAFTAEGAHQVDTSMVATHIARATLVYICDTKGRNHTSLVWKMEINMRYSFLQQNNTILSQHLPSHRVPSSVR